MAYALVDSYVATYPLMGVNSATINTLLGQASVMLEERLGSQFTTPFSSNNQTAIDLTVDFTRYRLLARTAQLDDSEEILKLIDGRITILLDGGVMSTTSGEAIYSTGAQEEIWSDTSGYKPTFDMRNEIHQRVDPDRIDDLDKADK